MMTDEERAKVVADLRKKTALHEAGHAAAMFLLGLDHRIVHIDMGGNEQLGAWVRVLHEPGWEWSLPGLIYHLMGPAAEGRLEQNSCWFDDLMIDGEHVEEEGSDAYRALAAAMYLEDGERPAWRLLRRVEGWCDELVANDRVWAMIMALAEKLETVDRLGGAEAVEILADAWGGYDAMPIAKLGRKWRRRMGMETKKPRPVVAAGLSL